MPLLGPSDSFNSSGATIVPDRIDRDHNPARTFSTLLSSSTSTSYNLRGRTSLDTMPPPSQPPYPSSQSTETDGDNAPGPASGSMGTGRALGPSDSFQSRLEEIYGPDQARMGLLQNGNLAEADDNPLQGLSGLLSRFNQDPTVAQINSNSNNDGFNPFSLVNDELSDHSDPHSYPQPSHGQGTVSPPFRPSSSTSHHSTHSVHSAHSTHSNNHATRAPDFTQPDAYRSDYSLSSTEVSEDMDTDDPDFDEPASFGHGPGGTGYDAGVSVGGLAIGTVNPGAFTSNRQQGTTTAAPPSSIFSSPSAWSEGTRQTTVSPDADGTGVESKPVTRPVGRPPRKRGSTANDDDDKSRVDRLEHRRSINRRSAQKHRLRRKEELEELTATIAERDKRIADLERELAATRAQLEQLTNLVRDGLKVQK